MTEVYGMNEGQVVSEQSSNVVTEHPQSDASSEKIFTQSEVNDIVKKAKHGAVEGFKRLSVERPEYIQQKHSGNEASFPRNDYQESSRQPEDDIRRIAAEEITKLHTKMADDAHRSSQEREAQRIVQEFLGKVVAGKDKYNDFDQVVGDVELAQFPNTVQLLHGYVDNVSDVMYELARDPIKMAQLETLARTSQKGAVKAIQSLSKSIKDNQDGMKMRTSKEPLDQLRPSNTGTDSGEPSVRDYRRKYRV